MNPTRIFQRSTPTKTAARHLFALIVERARDPAFYRLAGVPDTVDGRFEMIGLHLFLVLRRLREEERDKEQARALAQSLFDIAFSNFDANLREMGVGDLSVGAKVKQMAQGFYGRAAAYDEGLADKEGGSVEAALRRNLFGTVTPTEAQLGAMAEYLRTGERTLLSHDMSELGAGRVRFGAPPAGV